MRGSTTLWRALETARRLNLAAAGEAPPVAAMPGVTRRALIQGIAAVSVAAALPRPVRAFSASFSGGRVAIIGGGIAGLSALHHLRGAKVDARLYEARGRIGGRMFTRVPPDGSTAFEDGGQLVNSDHADMHALAGAFGVKLVDRQVEPHRTLILAGGRAVGDAELAQALRRIAAQIGADADRLDKDYAAVAPEIDRMSMAGYLDRYNHLIGAPWARKLLEDGSRTEYGVEPHQTSALALIFNLPTVDGTRVELLSKSDERYLIEGGSSALPEAIAARHADRIERGKRLARVAQQGATMQLDFADGTQVEAEALILAVPAPLTRGIELAVDLPPLWREFIAAMALGRNEKLQAAIPSRPWKAAMGGGELWNCDRAGYSLGWEGTVHLPGRAAPVWTWFLGGDEVAAASGPLPELAQRFGASVASVVPGMGEASPPDALRRTAWHADPLTQGAYVNYAPGQLTRFGKLLWIESDDPEGRQSAVAGNVLFAGEHLSDAFPGYMNGGAQTGRLAAQSLTGAGALKHAA